MSFPERLPAGSSWEGAEDDDQARKAHWGRFEAPPRHKEAIGKGIKSADLQNTAARKALAGTVGIVVLSGAPGCGKTLAAIEWLRSYVLHPERPAHLAPSARFITAPELARLDRYEDKSMRTLLRLQRLVLDDLGTEYNDKNGAFVSVFDEVINARHAAKLPTVITTNLSAAAFSERYGDRIIDRIREAGTFVACGSVSLRAPEKPAAPEKQKKSA